MSDILPDVGGDPADKPAEKPDVAADTGAASTSTPPSAPSAPSAGSPARPDPASAVPQTEMAAPEPAPPSSSAPSSAAPQTETASSGSTPPPKKSAFSGLGKGTKTAKAKKEDDTTGGPLMSVLVRNEFYRDGFRNMMWLAVIEAIVIAGLLVTFISYMNTSKAQDHYFATTADGRIMQLVPLERPNMNTSALLSWAAQSGTEVMTFGFDDYQRRLQQSSRFFTRHGWETFARALQQSRIIESITALNQVVSAVPRSAPILTQQGVFNGKYRWIVQLPLAVTYQSGSNTSRTDNLNVTLVIDRVPSLENPSGVGIEQWIATTNSND